MNVLIIGATSNIAHEVGKLFVNKKANLYLVGRDKEKIDRIANDYQVRGASVHTACADLADVSIQRDWINEAFKAYRGYDYILIAYGTLPNQLECEKNPQKAVEEIDNNFTSVASICLQLVQVISQSSIPHAVLGVITSVAGDRGRQSNFIYGAAKGGLSLFLQGLRNRVFKQGIQVLTIKPGFVDTSMTAHIKKGILFVKPAVVAKGIVRGMIRRKDVIYVPGFWRAIMCIIKSIPEFIFKRLSL